MLNENIRHHLALRHRTKQAETCATVGERQSLHREQRPLTIDKLATRLTNIEAEESIIIGVGYGVSPEAFACLQTLAKQLNAKIIGTRPAVDAGLIPHDSMVGQTGISIAPTYYLAFGISGQQLHTVGIAQSRYIVAINTDPTARLCQLADFVVVGDALCVANELLQTLEKQRSA